MTSMGGIWAQYMSLSLTILAIVPMIIIVLNLEPSEQEQIRGRGWSPPPILSDILNQEGGRLCPPYRLVPTKIFDIPTAMIT